MDPIKTIQKYYKKNCDLYNILLEHSRVVTKKALAVAVNVKHLNPDIEFIKEAGMLHDIGIYLTHDPEIKCFGDKPYVAHGYLGRDILEKEGFKKHALVCERHVGVGITINDIKKYNLPLPLRDMIPLSIEEKIICFADKFYTKNKCTLTQEKSIEEIKKGLARFGNHKVAIFE